MGVTVRQSIFHKYVRIFTYICPQEQKEDGYCMNINYRHDAHCGLILDQCKTETVKITNNVGYLELCCDSIIWCNIAANVNINLGLCMWELMILV